ncbi:MAG: hypothetical protein KBD48_03915 [Candidatus Pacebacteria bacterium]|nr:hypothetical protein [Candidatus Paceibacterota bacterium]
MLLVVGMLSTSKFASAAHEPGVKMETLAVEKDATEVALTETSYWKPKNSWGSSWKKIDILCPDGTIISMVDVPCDESISTAGWDEGMYTATLTDGTGASYTETFMVN